MKHLMIILLICFGFLSGRAHGQPNSTSTETTFQIGIPGERPQDSLQGLRISTSEIDTFLRNGRATLVNEVEGFGALLNRLEAEYGFTVGNNVSRTLVNEVFTDLESLRQGLIADIRTEILSIDEVRSISSIDLDLNPLKVTFTQVGTNIQVDLSTLTFNVRGKGRAGGILCGNFGFTAEFNRGRASVIYDVRQGRVIGNSASINVRKVNANCSSPIGDIIDIFLNERNLVESALSDAFRSFAGQTLLENLFSIDDTLNGLSALCVNVPDTINVALPRIPSGNGIPSAITVPGVASLCRSKAGATVDLARAVLDGGFEGSGLIVELFLIRNPNGNYVQLTASHNAPSVTIVDQISGFVTLSVQEAPNSRDTNAYVQLIRTGWTNVEAFLIGVQGLINVTLFEQLPDDTAIVAISESALIPGLFSFPSEQVRVDVPDGCEFVLCPGQLDPGMPGF